MEREFAVDIQMVSVDRSFFFPPVYRICFVVVLLGVLHISFILVVVVVEPYTGVFSHWVFFTPVYGFCVVFLYTVFTLYIYYAQYLSYSFYSIHILNLANLCFIFAG